MADLDDIELTLEELKTDISDIRKLIKNLPTATTEATTETAAEINIDPEIIKKAIALEIGNALVPLDKKIYTLFEMQKKDNQQMADSLNAVLERIYVILEKWATKVQALETNNTVLANTVKSSLDDLITPSIKNLIVSIRKELVQESRIASDTVSDMIRELIQGVPENIHKAEPEQPQITAPVPIARLPGAITKVRIPKFIIYLTVFNSFALLLILLRAH